MQRKSNAANVARRIQEQEVDTQLCIFSAYITMPPCKRCFAALVVAGVKKVVTRRVPPRQITDCAEKEGIEIFSLSQEDIQQQTARINVLIHGAPNGKKRNRDSNDDSETQSHKKEKEC